MLWLLRYIQGILKIKLSGELVEQFINSASKNGIFLWGMHFEDNDISCFVFARDFKYLPAVRGKTGVKIKILKKSGLPFLVRRYRKRSGLFLGAVLFLIVLKVLSLFIWSVDISGNSTVKSEEIVSACKSVGVYEGVRKSKVHSKNMADRLLLELPELAWCSLNIEGCVVTVNVTEVKNQPDKNKSVPSNLIATEDGIIKKIDVISGNTLVRVGDAVAKGDILVSGIIESMQSTAFVHSSGCIEAQIQKTFTKKADFCVIKNQPTGKTKKHIDLEFFSIKIPLYFTKIKGDFITEKNCKKLSIIKRNLPFSLNEEKYIFTNKIKTTRSEDALKKLLKNQIKTEIEEYGDENYKIKSEEYTVTQKGIELKITAVITTDIASEKQIIIG